MALGTWYRGSGGLGCVVLLWLLLGTCVLALKYEKRHEKVEGSGFHGHFSDEEDFVSSPGGERSHFDDDLIWFMESENRFNKVKNPMLDQESNTNTFRNNKHHFEKLDIKSHRKTFHESLFKKNTKISKQNYFDLDRKGGDYGEYPRKQLQASPVSDAHRVKHKQKKFYGSKKSQVIHDNHIHTGKSSELVISDAARTPSPYESVQNARLKHLSVNPFQKPVPTLRTGLNSESVDRFWNVDIGHSDYPKHDDQNTETVGGSSSTVHRHLPESKDHQHSEQVSWVGWKSNQEIPNYRRSEKVDRKIDSSKRNDGTFAVSSQSAIIRQNTLGQFDVNDSHMKGKAENTRTKQEETFGHFKSPTLADDEHQSSSDDQSSRVYEKVHSIKYYSSLLPPKREKTTIDSITTRTQNEIDLVEDHELIDGRTLRGSNPVLSSGHYEVQAVAGIGQEPACLHKCRQTLASLTISERPAAVLVTAHSQVNMACHVITSSEVNAVIGWRFGAEKDGCLPEKPELGQTVRKMWTEDWEDQQLRDSPECRQSGFASERISVNQTMIESRLQLNSVDASHSGRYICVARVECCRQGDDVYRHLSGSTETIVRVFDAKGSSHSTASRLAVAAAVVTCTLVGLAAAAALLKGCVRRKIARRLSGSAMGRGGYEAVRVYSQDPIFFAGAEHGPAGDDCVGTLIRAKKKQRARGAEYFSQYATDKDIGEARPLRQEGSVVTCSASPSIYPNPLDCISPDYEIPLTPDDPKIAQMNK